MEDIRNVIWSGSFMIGDIEIKCHVLEDGTRIIEKDSIHNLFNSDQDFTVEQATALAKWTKG